MHDIFCSRPTGQPRNVLRLDHRRVAALRGLGVCILRELLRGPGTGAAGRYRSRALRCGRAASVGKAPSRATSYTQRFQTAFYPHKDCSPDHKRIEPILRFASDPRLRRSPNGSFLLRNRAAASKTNTLPPSRAAWARLTGRSGLGEAYPTPGIGVQ